MSWAAMLSKHRCNVRAPFFTPMMMLATGMVIAQ
jgi:hypothetical protein